MDRLQAEELVSELYRLILKRQPQQQELAHWTKQALNGLTPAELVTAFARSPAYHRHYGVNTCYPAGHFYSPVVDPALVETYYTRERQSKLADISNIHVDVAGLKKLWSEIAALSPPRFSQLKQDGQRFYLESGYYCYSDAVVLRGILATKKPKHVIEIGSGFSTACMLDTIDEFGLETRITCIDPYADRLKAILTESDRKHVEIKESPVQEVPASFFAKLGAGDILFIDSTHVLKTGSDVHYELFHILPTLRPGVLIHFHDCPFPFEYPPAWVLKENKSWNEVYALRAFLMYNQKFKVIFWTTFVSAALPELFRQTDARMMERPLGSGIWLIKTD